MIYLIICILANTGIFIVFKLAGNRGLDSFRIIIINYFTAAILGFLIGGLPVKEDLQQAWIPMAIVIGILFIVVFYIIALSTQEAGMAVTSVASKMSVVIPITFSLFYFREAVSIPKIAGISLAILSVFMATYNRDKTRKRGILVVILPIIIFFSAGIIDSLIKYTQEVHLGGQNTVLFSSVLFSISAVTGLIISRFKKDVKSKDRLSRVIIAGIILGIVNFFSLYSIIMALESNFLDSSIIFGINNMGIVVLSVILALIFFGEKLSNLNKAGIILSIITIVFLSYL